MYTISGLTTRGLAFMVPEGAMKASKGNNRLTSHRHTMPMNYSKDQHGMITLRIQYQQSHLGCNKQLATWT